MKFKLEKGLAQLILGAPCYIVRPKIVQVKRGWKERLFSLPWNPLATHRTEVRSGVVAPNDCYFFEGKYWMGEEFHTALVQLAKENDDDRR